MHYINSSVNYKFLLGYLRSPAKNMRATNNNTLEDWQIIKSVVNICVYGNGKSYFLWNNALAYYKKLNHLFEDIKSDTPKDYLYPCFITLCSATLEYSLNLIYALYCFRNFEYEDYHSQLKPYRKKHFKEKLTEFPYIISGGKLITNENSQEIKSLYELITKQNGLLHNSEKLRTFDVPDINASIINDKLVIPSENSQIRILLSAEDNIIDSITKEDCIRIGNAIFSFYKQILLPYVNDDELNICDFIKTKN